MATIGINIAGGEFGGTGGTHNTNYHYPSYSDLKFYADKGVDFIRVPFRWERMQDALGGPLDLSGDLALIKQVLVDAATLGMDVILDCHNYGRYQGAAIGAAGGPTAAHFADFWERMALELKDYPALAGYDLMNEPHDMPTSTIWKEAAQAATDAIRKVDVENTIIIEGAAWSGAHSWQKYNSDLIIKDPANNIVYQAHQYFDKDNSGTYANSYDADGTYPMIGVDRLKPFVEWLNQHGLKGMIGETGVPSNDPRWIEVMKNSLDYMVQHNLDVTAWAGGTWWSDTYSMYIGRPGTDDSAFGDLLETYYNKFDGFETAGPSAAHTTPTVRISDSALDENAGTMTFTVTRSGDLSSISVVNYSTANGTATSGADYVAKTGTLSFAAGETTKTITVAVTSDVFAEADETLKVNLTAGSNARIHDALGVGTIRNVTDPAVSSVSINDGTVDEGAGTMTFTLTRSGPVAGTSSVTFATSNGSATAGSDYTALTGTVSFAAEETTKTITVAVADDSDVELAETLNVRLTGGANVTIVDALGVGTIAPSDVGPGVIIGTNATETVSGTTGDDAIYAFDGHDTIMGSLGADFVDGGAGGDQINYVSSDAAVNVDLARTAQQGGHAEGDQLASIIHIAGSNHADVLTGSSGNNDLNGNGGHDVLTGGAGADRFIFESAAEADGDTITDYTSQDRLSFTSGVPTTTNFSLSNDGANTTLAGDTNRDGVRDFAITLKGVHTALNGVILPTVTINDVTADETTGTVTFTVTRSGLLLDPSSVSFATKDGTATAGSDYTGLTGTISFAAGEATKTISIAVTNDTLVESTETLTVNLTGGTNVAIWDAQGVGTINSEDVAPAPAVVVNDVTVSETAGSLVFTITRSGDLSGASSVNYATDDGSATAGSDYTASNGTVTFAAGQATASVSVQVLDDTLVENPEAFTLNLSGGTNITITDARGVGTINSEDVAPAPTVAVNDVAVSETAGSLVFTITRSGDLSDASSVNYATADGSATAGSDYTASNGTVTFAAGQATASVSVQVLDDTLVENPEAFTLNLSGGTNITVADAQGVGTITSEDVAPAPTVAVNDVTVSETAGSLVFTITRSGDLSDASSVNYATAGGTATAGSDYTAANGTVTFAAGQATATVSIQVADDTLVENPETFNLDLSGGTNITIADARGVGTINSEDVTGTIYGTNAGETINGTSGNDVINALGGNDVLNGRGGADRLTGGTGSDRFVFDSATNANGDVVSDFTTGSDKLDFRAFDADVNRKGVQKFTWLDSGQFTGKAGQLREYELDGKHFIEGDIDGRGGADFTIEVAGTTNLTSTDLLL